jgi:hypothetical protein
MTLELRKTESEAIQSIWADWKASDGKSLELEVSFGRVGLTGFLDTVNRLRSLGLKEEPQQPKLNICMPGGMRFTIVGEGPIRDYCISGDINKVPYNVLLKERHRVKDKPDQADLADYNVRVKMRREVQLSKRNARVVDLLSRWAKTPKRFRYIKRFTFIGPEDTGYRFDLSAIRESERDSRGDYKGTETLQMANIMSRPTTYEIEVEAIHKVGTKTYESPNGILSGAAIVLQGLQRSFVLVRRKVAIDVATLISAATGAPSNKFPGPQPATLEKVNIAAEAIPNVANIRYGNYNVTDKADGLRTLLVVNKDRIIYLVDSSFNVYGTGLQLDSDDYVGTVLDGEWIRTNKKGETVSLYYAFDIFAKGTTNVVDAPFIDPSSDTDRHTLMKETIAGLITARFKEKDIPSAHKLIISMKTFHSTGVDPGYIFKDAAACLDAAQAEDNPYYADGLIFTPNLEPLPMGGRTWEAQLKWKPSHDNTIDFLVSFEKTDGERFKYEEDEKQMVRYKTLRLFVGGDMDPLFRDPRQSILGEVKLPDVVDDDKYRPVEFFPSAPSDPQASVCYVALDAGAADPSGSADAAQDLEATDENIYCTRSKDAIPNNSIVEFAYNPEKAAGWRWEPIRVRWDKTERYQRGEIARTMNADWVADKVWASIHNPVNEEMVRTGVLSEAAAAGEEKAVYYKKSVGRDNFAIRGLNRFHNESIKSDLYSKTLKKGDALMDLSCGRAGDLWKWLANEVSWVLGTDSNLDCLNTPKTGAYGRYLDQKIKLKDKLAPMIFVQASSTSNIRDSSAGVNGLDKTILKCLYDGAVSEAVPPAVVKLAGAAKGGFDVVSCMFALHYFFKDRASVDGFLRNVSDNLKVGGYFTGCCFDGDSVHKLLAKIPSGGVKTGRDGPKDIWSIRRSYESGIEDVLPPNDSGLGRAIDVFFMSIGEEHREYLVSWEYLVNRMKEIGCELLLPDELAAMKLQGSTARFGDSYKSVGAKYPMSRALQDFSFLNRWFIFRRRSQGSVVSGAPDMNSAPEVFELPPKAPSRVVVQPLSEPAIVKPTVEESLAPALVKEESVKAVVEPVPVGGRPLYKFFHSAVLKDDLGVGRKDWARYISSFTYSQLRDLDDPAVIYPTLEAAFAAERFKKGTDQPQLGPKLFGSDENLHQKYLKQMAGVNDKRKYELLEDEGSEVRELLKPASMKKVGAKWNETKWLEARDAVMAAYIRQRYETDAEFKRILDLVKAKNGLLVFYNGTRPSEMGGLVKEGGVIDGQNKLGQMYMSVIA